MERMTFRDQSRSQMDSWSVPQSSTKHYQGTERRQFRFLPVASLVTLLLMAELPQRPTRTAS